MPNTERLLELGRWAIAEDAKQRAGLPSEWDQGKWFSRASGCGTACCMAGKVVLDDGGYPIFRNGELSGIRALMPDGSNVFADDYAAVALDLPFIESEEGSGSWRDDALFNASNSLDDVLRIIAELTGVDLR